MLRFWLLGGAWPRTPWEVFVTLGGALVGAGVAFVFLFPLWSSYPIVGEIEMAIFLGAGCTLVTAGIVRRKQTPPVPWSF
jgi:uncharacterized membrane protein YccC